MSRCQASFLFLAIFCNLFTATAQEKNYAAKLQEARNFCNTAKSQCLRVLCGEMDPKELAVFRKALSTLEEKSEELQEALQHMQEWNVDIAARTKVIQDQKAELYEWMRTMAPGYLEKESSRIAELEKELSVVQNEMLNVSPDNAELKQVANNLRRLTGELIAAITFVEMRNSTKRLGSEEKIRNMLAELFNGEKLVSEKLLVFDKNVEDLSDAIIKSLSKGPGVYFDKRIETEILKASEVVRMLFYTGVIKNLKINSNNYDYVLDRNDRNLTSLLAGIQREGIFKIQIEFEDTQMLQSLSDFK